MKTRKLVNVLMATTLTVGILQGCDAQFATDLEKQLEKSKEKKEEKQDDKQDEKKVTVCHIPPGNPQAAHTLDISESALKAHLDHGDTQGPCPEVIPPKEISPPPKPEASASPTPEASATPAPEKTPESAPSPIPSPSATQTSPLPVESTVPGQPPLKPTGLKANYVLPYSFELDWDAVDGADSYTVYSNGNVLVKSIKENKLDYKSAFPGSNSDITVKAINAHGESLSSDKINVITPKSIIAFAASRDGNNEIYAMSADEPIGLKPALRLTNNSTHDSQPAISPDGKQIAYTSHTGVSTDILMMDTDGSNQKPLTTTAFNYQEPAWAPNGKTLAMTSNHGGINGDDVFLMAHDGTGITRLSNHPGSFDRSPDWSPDGNKIAYASEVNGIYQIFVVEGLADITKDVTTLPHTQLTSGTTHSEYPAWSPDGKQIAFTKGGAVQIMNADGSNSVVATKTFTSVGRPRWMTTSQGQAVAFNVTNNGDGFIKGTDIFLFLTANLPATSAFGVLVNYDGFDLMGSYWKAP